MNTKNRESSSSDDGYNSDEQSRKMQKYYIARDTTAFKKKYQVTELLNNSANGVIYSGKFQLTASILSSNFDDSTRY